MDSPLQVFNSIDQILNYHEIPFSELFGIGMKYKSAYRGLKRLIKITTTGHDEHINVHQLFLSPE